VIEYLPTKHEAKFNPQYLLKKDSFARWYVPAFPALGRLRHEETLAQEKKKKMRLLCVH
jgi:hypothetical protein